MKHLESFIQGLCFLVILAFLAGCSTRAFEAPRVPNSPMLDRLRITHTSPLQQALQPQDLRLGSPVFIRIFKKERMLEAWVQETQSGKYRLFKSYPICRFSGDLGPKQAEGDKQAPEGFYMVGAEQLNPNSQYHLAFNLGFPNEFDESQGYTGSFLMVHGGCQSVGCYAMTDEAMEEIYLLVEASIAAGSDVPVHIFPFRMDEVSIYSGYYPQWSSFWANLVEGYRMFEATHIPPKVEFGTGLYGNKYVFQMPEVKMAAAKPRKNLVMYTNFNDW